jgi:2-dehydro-3-deoxyphosphooctonate aldolase (KDO 8-P synthase)
LVAGPCVIESEDHLLRTGEAIKEACTDHQVPFILKSSYDKANRSSGRSFRGPGLQEGLRILQRVKEKLGVPVLSDVHEVDQVLAAAEVLDIIQIPAFLCRQTDLLLAAARTGKPVNVKKGQFLAPWDAGNIVEKLRSAGSEQIILTERGTSFGYHNLVVDIRSLPVMRSLGYPVLFDATHSLQLPGGAGQASSGQAEFIPYLARAAVAAGVDGLFMEVHPDPANAPSDGPNMLRLDALPGLLRQVIGIQRAVAPFVNRNDRV